MWVWARIRHSPTFPLMLFSLFHQKFAIITPGVITGSFAERVKFTSYLIFICPLFFIDFVAGARDLHLKVFKKMGRSLILLVK